MPKDDCWLWAGAVTQQDYGTHGHRGLAHRVVYEALVGNIPPGLDLDHLCRVPRCVNPEHLEPVTRGENLRRGVGSEITRRRFATMTHCRRGHRFETDTPRYNGSRHCRVCTKLNMRKYRKRG